MRHLISSDRSPYYRRIQIEACCCPKRRRGGCGPKQSELSGCGHACAESGERFKLQPYDSDSESLRTLLPRSGATAELSVPMHWPAKGVPLQLKSISTGQDAVDLLQAMAVLQKQPELAYSSIGTLLQAVDEAVTALLAQAGQEA